MWSLNVQEIFSAFIVLFAIIDVTGSLPIFIDLKEKEKTYSSFKASFFSFLILLAFFFVGEGVLKLFGVDVSSFAVAGAIVLFVIGCEMIFGIEIFKSDGPSNNATIVPIIFPLLAGPGAFTALLSLKAEYNSINIIIALLINMFIVYLVLRNVNFVQKKIGAGGIYVLRKFFGIILLAISVKLFVSNIASLLGS
ncbi:multiple antibiotic resistance protein [Dysgonomonadaceae bacterium PH5-43]|nr:multiple antibiotic resistance protein [Dysgonomonadaceae bacterium PH5-43]